MRLQERKEQYVRDLERKSTLLDDVLERERQYVKDLAVQNALVDESCAKIRALETSNAELHTIIDSMQSPAFPNQQSNPGSSSSSHPLLQHSSHPDAIRTTAREADFDIQQRRWKMERSNYHEELRRSESPLRVQVEEKGEMREREGMLRGMLEESRRDNAIKRTEIATASARGSLSR